MYNSAGRFSTPLKTFSSLRPLFYGVGGLRPLLLGVSFSPVALASAVIVTKYVIFVNFDTCFKNTVALYVVIKIIDKIVKIITLLCCICNNCFVNIVGI